MKNQDRIFFSAKRSKKIILIWNKNYYVVLIIIDANLCNLGIDFNDLMKLIGDSRLIWSEWSFVSVAVGLDTVMDM